MEKIIIDGKRTNMQIFDIAKKHTIGAINKRKDIKFNHASPCASKSVIELFQLLFYEIAKVNNAIRYPDWGNNGLILKSAMENGGSVIVNFNSPLIDNVEIVVK